MKDYVKDLTKLFEYNVTYDSIISNITNKKVKDLFSQFISDYSSELPSGGSFDPVFKKSLLNCIRIMDYVVNNNLNVEFYIPRGDMISNETTIHCGALLKKGTITIQIVPGKNILNYSYARRSEHGKGIITTTGCLKITAHPENTSDALNLIFGFGK